MGRIKPNEQQQLAINAIDGPVLISAGPGTGKTATLVNRYYNMVTNYNIAPVNIMIATFMVKLVQIR